MTIQHKQKDKRGQFFIPEGDTIVAEMTYIRHDEHTIVIDHTEVDPKLQGKNIGYDLVAAAVEYAREEKLKIIPVCTFARRVFDKKEEYGDVLKKDEQ